MRESSRSTGPGCIDVAQTHANYFVPGAHVARVCRAGVCGQGLDSVPFDLRELQYQGEGEKYALVQLAGPPYTVGFGTGNFIIRGLVRTDSRPFPDPRRRQEFVHPLLDFKKASEAQ